ncbi:DUF4870 family protein [Brevundimonas sp. R86498]|uniref:DUF4870 family protein n=1 Tax=Brevundimonas sp. R86498 TaxID=3093845 RepID=UPI0037C71D28
MAEPGDPNAPETPESEVDHDAGVGFSSAASLKGRPRAPIADTPPVQEPVAVTPEPAPEPAPPVLDRPAPPVAPAAPEPVMDAAPPAWARETPRPAAPPPVEFGTARRTAPAEIEGGLGLFSVYALILFAVPTLGVSALIALLAVTGRPGPQGELAASHFLFQQRTLWAGAVVALLGGILIAVGLGVFVLFVLALWLILRGAGGVLKLREGQPIANPRTWLL